jgi:hypothetical protein
MRCCVVRGGGSGFASQRLLSAGFFRTRLDAVAPTDEGVTLEVAVMDTDNVENIWQTHLFSGLTGYDIKASV